MKSITSNLTLAFLLAATSLGAMAASSDNRSSCAGACENEMVAVSGVPQHSEGLSVFNEHHVAHLCDSTDPSYTDQLSVDSNLFHDALAIAGVKAGRACIAYEAMLQTGQPMHLIAENIHCYEARLIYFKLQARKNEHDYQYQQRVGRGGR